MAAPAQTRRRVTAASANRVQRDIEALSSKWEKEKLESDLKELVAELRERPEYVMRVKAFISSGCGMKPTDAFPRGIKTEAVC